jgi:hypothetical protein
LDFASLKLDTQVVGYPGGRSKVIINHVPLSRVSNEHIILYLILEDVAEEVAMSLS